VQSRQLGNSNIEASVVGLGTWAIGGWMWGGTDESNAIAAIQASIDAGVTLIDTAPAYGMGLSEKIVGKAINGRRDKVILSTKCGLVWHTTEGNHFFDASGKPVHRYLGGDSIRYEVEQSLQRLGVETIDIYHTHWQDQTTPIAETVQTLLDLKQEGKIRSIAASNISVEDVEAYCQAGQLDAVQEKYNMLDRDLEESILPYCRANNVSVLSYSSLALGLLTGKIGPERQFSGDDLRIGNPRFTVENRQKVATLLAGFKPIALERDISLAQLAIAWTLAQPGITYALCGARNAQQATENAQAGNIVLTGEELTRMNEVIEQHAGDIV
jgi:aryl-alcohol dehydrogenase-like predicted oxidoreductase